MRIIIQHYENDQKYAYQTSDSGKFEKDIEGARQPGVRIKAVVEILCDNNDDGRKALLDTLEEASKIVKAA